MRLYEDIIRERSLKSGDRKNHLLELERTRAYQLRIEQLMTDIRNFDSRIGSLDGKIGGLDADYRNKVDTDLKKTYQYFIQKISLSILMLT